LKLITTKFIIPSGCTAGSFLAACGVGPVTAIANFQRNRNVSYPQLRSSRSHPAKLQRLQSCKTGITAQKGPVGDNTGVSRENILLEIPDRLFAAALLSCDKQHRQQPSQQKQQQSSEKHTRLNTNETSSQSVQDKSVNNKTTDVFLAFSMVQQIMTDLSGAATEEENNLPSLGKRCLFC
jgi:hypothetical protein